MRKKEAEALGAIAGIGTILVVAGVIEHVKTVRVERKKRKNVEKWLHHNLDAIRSSSARIQRLAEDPSCTMEDLAKAWVEEAQFCKLIREQPMY